MKMIFIDTQNGQFLFDKLSKEWVHRLFVVNKSG